MTEDLTAAPGRAFVGVVGGSLMLVTVKSVRRRGDGTPSSCVLVGETPGVGGEPLRGEYNIRLGKSGELTGLRRVTLAHVGTAKQLTQEIGHRVPTDAVVIVTRDRVGSGQAIDPKGIG